MLGTQCSRAGPRSWSSARSLGRWRAGGWGGVAASRCLFWAHDRPCAKGRICRCWPLLAWPKAHPAGVDAGQACGAAQAEPVSFSRALERAWVAGLLENDPVLDLSSEDAAAKLLALARELGC